jgi:hypothetical protein
MPDCECIERSLSCSCIERRELRTPQDLRWRGGYADTQVRRYRILVHAVPRGRGICAQRGGDEREIRIIHQPKPKRVRLVGRDINAAGARYKADGRPGDGRILTTSVTWTRNKNVLLLQYYVIQIQIEIQI